MTSTLVTGVGVAEACEDADDAAVVATTGMTGAAPVELEEEVWGVEDFELNSVVGVEVGVMDVVDVEVVDAEVVDVEIVDGVCNGFISKFALTAVIMCVIMYCYAVLMKGALVQQSHKTPLRSDFAFQ